MPPPPPPTDSANGNRVWNWIVGQYRPYRDLRDVMNRQAARASAVRVSILRAHGLTTTQQAQQNPARLGNDRERYDLAGRIMMDCGEDLKSHAANLGRIAAMAQTMRRLGAEVPGELGLVPVIPIAIVVAILLIAGALYVAFKSASNREDELKLVEQANTTNTGVRAQIADVIAQREAGKLTPEEAAAYASALAATGAQVPSPDGSTAAEVWKAVKEWGPVAAVVGLGLVAINTVQGILPRHHDDTND